MENNLLPDISVKGRCQIICLYINLEICNKSNHLQKAQFWTDAKQIIAAL